MKRRFIAFCTVTLAAALFAFAVCAGVLGDFTGDGDVKSDDAVYLLRHTLFGNEYPLNGNADFTGDGSVTSDDAIYLLRHTLFPGDYPLKDSTVVVPLEQYLSFSDKGDGTLQVSVSDKSKLPSRVVIPPSYNGKTVTYISGGTFAGTSIDVIVMPSTITGIGGYAFDGCSSLYNVSLPMSLTSVGDSVFRDCTSLTSISIPSNLEKISGSMFSGCSSLSMVTIPSGVKEIGRLAFSGCSALTEAELPSGVTVIEMAAFQSCSSLTTIKIPASVTSIGSSAFNNCKNLKDIWFGGTKEQWNAITKGDSWNYNTGKYVVHCTNGNVNK